MLKPLPQSNWSRRLADHLLSRAGFGGTPIRREALYQLGRKEGVAAAVSSLVDVVEDWSDFPIPEWVGDQNEATEIRGIIGRFRFGGWYLTQMHEAQPLAAKMLKFHVDHFPIDWGTIQNNARFVYFFRHFDILRQRALGDFQELVRDVSWSEGMIRMLDLYRSFAGRVNENFARELMELFTLGVDGGYTEQDVAAAAAAFTGRLLRRQFPYQAYQLRMERGHPVQDTSVKSFLGTTIVTGDNAIDIIFEKIQCAYHMSWKLWRYFASPNPDEALLQELARRLKFDYSYELLPLLRDIFLSEEFYQSACIGRRVKDPIDFVISVTQALETDLIPPYTGMLALERLGYHPMFPPDISGWPEPEGVGNQWLTAGNSMVRFNLPTIWSYGSARLLGSQRALRTIGEDQMQPQIDLDLIAPAELRPPTNFNLLVNRLNDRLLPFHRLRSTQRRALYDHYLSIRERVNEETALRELIRLMLALPEFQLH